MALADFAAFKSKIAEPDEVINFVNNQLIPAGTGWSSFFTSSSRGFNGRGTEASKPGTTPTLCDRNTPGSFGQRNAPAGQTSHVWVDNLTTNVNMMLMVADRLAHVSGLNATLTTAQAVNFPALTRYTSGQRVMAAIEIYTSLGSTVTTVTMNYTNQDGVAKTSPPITIGSTGDRPTRILVFNLAAGDTGVRNVASVTLAASTATAGDFGVTLFRPLVCIPMGGTNDYLNTGDPLRALSLQLPRVLDDACLQFMGFASGQVALQMSGDINLMWT